MARKRRTRPSPGRQARAAAARSGARTPPPPPAPLPAERLPWSLDPRQKIALLGIFLTGIGSFVGLADGYDTLEEYPFLPGALTVAALAFGYLLERDVIDRRGRRVLRFAGFGVLAPVAVGLVGYAALTPISVLFGLTAYRLGLGSLTPPAVVAALGTFLVVSATEQSADTLNPAIVAYLVTSAALWPGAGVLLLTRNRG